MLATTARPVAASVMTRSTDATVSGRPSRAACAAGAIGIPCVKLKNFRSKYVGETEGNLERVLRVLRSMGPVVVIVDEADAMLGDRDQGGDSGVSSRVFGMIAAQIEDRGAPPATLGPGEGPVPALDLVIPPNGYEADVLQAVRVTNLLDATDADLAEIRLWRDDGDGDFNPALDLSLGPFSFDSGADEWTSPALAETVGTSGLLSMKKNSVRYRPTPEHPKRNASSISSRSSRLASSSTSTPSRVRGLSSRVRTRACSFFSQAR